MHEYWYMGTKRNTNKYFSTYGNILCFQCTYGNKYRGNKHMGHFNSKIFPYNKYMGSLSNSSHMTLKRSHINLKMLYGTFYPTYGMILRYKVPICFYFFQILFPYDINSPIYVLYGTNLDKIWDLSVSSVVEYLVKLIHRFY